MGIRAEVTKIIEESEFPSVASILQFRKGKFSKAVFEAGNRDMFRWFDSELPLWSVLRSIFWRCSTWCETWFGSGNFYSLLILSNAVAEHEQSNGWVQEVANSYREKISARFQTMVAECGVEDPQTVTEKLNLLIDGAIVTSDSYRK